MGYSCQNNINPLVVVSVTGSEKPALVYLQLCTPTGKAGTPPARRLQLSFVQKKIDIIFLEGISLCQIRNSGAPTRTYFVCMQNTCLLDPLTKRAFRSGVCASPAQAVSITEARNTVRSCAKRS